MYQIRIAPGASRYFKKIKNKNLKNAFKNAVVDIGKDPYIGEAKTGDLTGVYCYDLRHKGISYEIAYTIVEHTDKIVVIVLAGTRGDFYTQLKRYIKNTHTTLDS